MCVVSAIGDNWRQTVPGRYPWVTQPSVDMDTVSRAEFQALRREMEELRKLLLAAKDFDSTTGQADCEVDEKVGLIKRLAELVGVDVDDVFSEGSE